MSEYLPYIIVMAATTYLIRMLPLTLFKKEIQSIRIKSFLFYVPYAVLGAMTFPAVFTAAGALLPSLAGTGTALYFAWREKSLLFVAAAACISAFLCDALLSLF